MRNGNQVQNFRYPVIHRAGLGAADVLNLVSDAGRQPGREQALQQELAAAVEAARIKGVQRRSSADLRRQRRRPSSRSVRPSTAAVRDFAQQRSDYFRRVESELVRLAMAIARKVLHREAQMDPLLLAGVVRVALDQMQAGTRLTLRTSPGEVEAWRQFCAKDLEDRQGIEVVADTSLEFHQCVLQAEAGSTEISLEGQLQEIESGFFDLLEAHPGGEP